MKILQLTILLVLFFTLCSSSCGDCGTQKEPELALTITRANQNAYPLLSRIRVANSSKLVPKNQDGVFLMPLDLNRDKTQFIFEFNSGQEYILTIGYTRQTKFYSSECGVIMEIENAKKIDAESSPDIQYADVSFYDYGFISDKYRPKMSVSIQ